MCNRHFFPCIQELFDFPTVFFPTAVCVNFKHSNDLTLCLKLDAICAFIFKFENEKAICCLPKSDTKKTVLFYFILFFSSQMKTSSTD